MERCFQHALLQTGESELDVSVGTHYFGIRSNSNTTFFRDWRYSLSTRKTGGSSAVITNVSVKEYLGQEVVPDSGCGSWLFEPQSTNLITYSEDFSQSFWTKQASVTLDKGYLAPDGTYNATKISGVIAFFISRFSSGILIFFAKGGN